MSSSLSYKPEIEFRDIELPTSKSISNRLLIAQALSNHQFEIKNLSSAADTTILQKALLSESIQINLEMAGTAYRFLTAFYSIQNGEKILTGAERMYQRPIEILVNQLRELGAQIEYVNEKRYPPLKIVGKQLKSKVIEVDGSVSSQYISALLLIAPSLNDGLSIRLTGEIVSKPYINMTIKLLSELGITISIDEDLIKVKNGSYFSYEAVNVEYDWSSAAFFYQLTALSAKSIKIKGLSDKSIQGDRKCADLFSSLGVETEFHSDGVLLSPINNFDSKSQFFDMSDYPDLIPSIVVVASQLINKTIIKGISTLKIKESNRVEALTVELAKIGVQIIELENDSILIHKGENDFINMPINFEVHNDHRMAMCLAPLVIKYQSISIDNPNVVEKSFPDFWKEIEKVGVVLS